jgi:hypothetical protein
MSGQIFISYRRDDASYPAGRLYDRLCAHFGQNRLFMDVDMVPGIDFIEEIEKNVGSCDVLIAIIGKCWLNADDEEGKRRLDQPEDYVRLEIATALKRGIRVIPVLVGDASMPRPGELPDDLQPLTRRNALSVSHDRFRADAERLISAVEQVLESARVELQHDREEQKRRGRGSRQHETEPFKRIGIGARAPPSNQSPPTKEGTANLETPWSQLLIAIGSGVAVCVLGFSLFSKALRPHSVSVEESSASVPTAPSNSPSPTPFNGAIPLRPLNPVGPLGRQALPIGGNKVMPSPTEVLPTPNPFGADSLAEAKRYLDEAKHYLDEGDYVKALPLLGKATNAGSAEAMYDLGVLHEFGRGVPQDYANARFWYQQADYANSAGAKAALRRLSSTAEIMREYGSDYELRSPPDYANARFWYQKAADAGNAEAKRALSRLPREE